MTTMMVMMLMLTNVVWCHVMCRVVSCRVVSCRVVSCRVVSCHVLSCHVMSCHVMSCDAGHKLWMFTEHKGFVQGVAVDPLGHYLATLSDDRLSI